MTTIKVKYESLLPELKNQTQFFTGINIQECYEQMFEFNDWLSKGQDFKTMYNIKIVKN